MQYLCKNIIYRVFVFFCSPYFIHDFNVADTNAAALVVVISKMSSSRMSVSRMFVSRMSFGCIYYLTVLTELSPPYTYICLPYVILFSLRLHCISQLYLIGWFIEWLINQLTETVVKFYSLFHLAEFFSKTSHSQKEMIYKLATSLHPKIAFMASLW